jgi:uncharacterized protein YggE
MGKGQVSVNPDLAIIRLGVQTTGDNVTEAQNENARLSQDVINSLKQAGITDLQTVQYQVDKLYDFENGKQIDRGYQIRNILEIRTGEMELIGTLIDTAVYYGANIVESVRFDVSNQDIYYQKALNLAVKNAIQKSKSIAISLGIFPEPVPVLITENPTAPIPYSNALMMRGEIAAATPIESGYLQINASVTIEFIY